MLKKVEFLEKRRLEQKLRERNRNRKLKQETQGFLFSLNQEKKHVLRVVELEIRFHGYETQIISS